MILLQSSKITCAKSCNELKSAFSWKSTRVHGSYQNQNVINCSPRASFFVLLSVWWKRVSLPSFMTSIHTVTGHSCASCVWLKACRRISAPWTDVCKLDSLGHGDFQHLGQRLTLSLWTLQLAANFFFPQQHHLFIVLTHLCFFFQGHGQLESVLFGEVHRGTSVQSITRLNLNQTDRHIQFKASTSCPQELAATTLKALRTEATANHWVTHNNTRWL